MDRHVKEDPLFGKEIIGFVKHDNTQEDTQCQMLLKIITIFQHVIEDIDDTEIDPGNVHGLTYASVYVVSPMVQRGQTQDPHQETKVMFFDLVQYKRT